jgi:hypothetical protein
MTSPAAGEGHTTRRNPEMERYVEVRPVVMEGSPDAHNVFLKVTNQSFCVTKHSSETKEEAEWTRDMLCVALAKIASDVTAVNSYPKYAEMKAALIELISIVESIPTPDEDQECTELCGNSWCNEFGCIPAKIRLARDLSDGGG